MSGSQIVTLCRELKLTQSASTAKLDVEIFSHVYGSNVYHSTSHFPFTRLLCFSKTFSEIEQHCHGSLCLDKLKRRFGEICVDNMVSLKKEHSKKNRYQVRANNKL